MKNQKERLKKLYALAMYGVGGEKEEAQAILDKLLKKYAMTLDDLDEEFVNEYRLEYHGRIQEKLLKQTVYKVTDDAYSFYNLQYTVSGRKCRTLLGVKCTEAQKMEIEFLFDFYKRVWEKELDIFLSAFIQKHDIFGNPKDDQKMRTHSDDELRKIAAFMYGLSDEMPLLQIEGKVS